MILEWRLLGFLKKEGDEVGRYEDRGLHGLIEGGGNKQFVEESVSFLGLHFHDLNLKIYYQIKYSNNKYDYLILSLAYSPDS